MVKINFVHAADMSLEQMIGFEMSAIIWEKLLQDDIEINILTQTTNELDSNVIGGAIPEFHEQHYGLFLEYFEADITSQEDQLAYDALQQGNTIDFLLNGDLVGGNTKLKLTTALAKALGMTEAISLDRYVLDEESNFLDGTILMNQNFTWDFNYLRDSEAAENTLDFLSVALHETGHILGFTSSVDYSLEQNTLYSGRTELNNFSPLDLFRFSAESLGLNNPDGSVNDLSVGGVAWFSTDGGETLAAKMSTGKEGDGYQASHWERRYDPLGIMDPTLWYQERASITDLDVLAFDIIGYDLTEGAGDVEQLFTNEGLELLLAEAKVQLADKLGVSVQWIEDNADVPVSSLDLIAQMEAEMVETAPSSNNPTETLPSNSPSPAGNSTAAQDGEEVDDLIQNLNRMMGETYQWWWQNNGNNGSSWQELYEWWWQNNGNNGSSWQELYEWWWQNNGNNGSSWQELYEWWWQNNGNNGTSWQEIEEWFEEDKANQGSWWQEVFFATNESAPLDNIDLPGESNNTVDVTYTDISSGADDEIIGGDISNDNIIAGIGDDLIDGAAGDDTIVGGEGYDTIFGFDGNDSIMGGAGDDLISGESDKDALFGQTGDDVLMGGDQDDYLDGGAGRDFLNGESGHDALVGGADDDLLEGQAGKDLLVGGQGEDIGNGGSGDDFIFGDEYSESLKQEFGSNLSNLTNLFATESSSSETSVENNTNPDNSNTANVVLDIDPVVTDNNNSDNSSNSSTVNNPTPGIVRMEAEEMTLSGGYYPDNSFYSGTVIRTSSSNPLGVASSTFTGDTGYYEVVVRYVDESDGNSNLSVKIGETEIDSWVLDQNTSGSNQYYTRTISEGMYIDANDVVEIQGQAENWEFARVDYIEFIPIEAPTDNTAAPTDNTSDNSSSSVTLGTSSDILRGGAGNDGIDGGEGNDLIFGEDESNDSSNIAPINIPDSYNYGQSTYILSQAGTWEEAQAEAESYGGNLVTINDAAENKWLLDTFGVNNDWLWIGFTDQNQEGQFEWISGQEVTYTNWAPGQPYDDGGDQEYAILNWNNQGWDDNQGTWQWQGIIEVEWSSVGGNDTILGSAGDDQIYGNSGNDLLYGDDTNTVQTPVLDTNREVYNGSQYLVLETAVWEKAQAEAESLGGNLVTINDAAEEKWLQDTFGTSEMFWIGLSDAETEGTWKWASGEVSDWVKGEANEGIYTNWSPGQPDDYNGFQDYAVMNYTMSGTTANLWDDHNSDNQYRSIIEIKLPNDNLTGNGGNDTISGGAGDDIINGTDEIVAGYYEKDVLIGGTGADTFILGNSNQAYYATAGNQDYAVIEDFDFSLDTLQLYGSAVDYQQQQQGNDVFLSRNGDLVVILENTSTFNLNDSSVEYV